MPAPIAVEIAANPAPTPDLAQALVGACARAAGPDGCVLADPGGPLAQEPRARVVVSFADGVARVHVEALITAGGEGRAGSRDAAFRDEDPPGERYRAAGLVAAALVAELETPPRAPEPPPPPAPAAPAPIHRTDLRLDGGAGLNANRPWLLGELGADFLVRAPLFVTVSALYGQTASRDADGVVAQRSALAVGAGVDVPIAGGVAVRVRANVTANVVRASVVQPVTQREDAGARALVGASGDIDLLVPLGGPVGITAGLRIGDLGGTTAIRVQNRGVESVEAWIPSVVLGLDLRLP
jgi:hypothetical protein